MATLRVTGLDPDTGDFLQVDILGEGEITKKLTIKANAASAVAKEKIEKAGGSIEVLA